MTNKGNQDIFKKGVRNIKGPRMILIILLFNGREIYMKLFPDRCNLITQNQNKIVRYR